MHLHSIKLLLLFSVIPTVAFTQIDSLVKEQQARLLEHFDYEDPSDIKVKISRKGNVIRFTHPIYSGDDVILYFDENDLLVKYKKMMKGFIKYNNSWAGSSNSQKIIEYDENNLVASIKHYSSHDRWFGKYYRITTYYYDQDYTVERCEQVYREWDFVSDSDCQWLYK